MKAPPYRYLSTTWRSQSANKSAAGPLGLASPSSTSCPDRGLPSQLSGSVGSAMIRDIFLIASVLPFVAIGTDSANGISPSLFDHHYITQDLPGNVDWGYGGPASADFDRDGHNDFAFGIRGGNFHWFEYRSKDNWKRHEVGPMRVRTLGGGSLDVDKDGWTDILAGGYWYRNPQNPREEPFEVYRYDDSINSEIHDLVIADMDGDGQKDVVVLGDEEGAFWYQIPSDPKQNANWERHTITMAVLDSQDDIHSGFFPKGIGDLDGDGDADIVLPDRWLANQGNGLDWVKRDLPFGNKGPWGLSARSWIVDLDDDSDNDIVMVDSDQTGCQAAWLESDGGSPPHYDVHRLPKKAKGGRGSFHSLAVADFDDDGDLDIFTVEQEDDSLLPKAKSPRWLIWEQVSGDPVRFKERVILQTRLGGHDALVRDVDADGDLDIVSKIWNRWPKNGNQGREHADYLENTLR